MRLHKSLTALLAGSCLTLAFAPFCIFPIAVIAPALLLYVWRNVKPRQSFWYGWLYGLGFFGMSVSWVFVSMHRFGGLPIPIASLFTLLFAATLALFPAVQGYLLNRFFPTSTPVQLLLAFPISCALTDWLRSWLFSGFPWVLLGYSQTNSPLKGFAPIIGEYGLAFIITLCSGLLVLAWLKAIPLKKASRRSLVPLSVLIVIWLVGLALTHIEWTTPQHKPIKVSLVQGNIPQQLKWQADFIQPTLDRYVSLTSQHWDSDLIIWPEAAIPLAFQYAGDFLTYLDQQAKQHKTRILLGIPEEIDDIHYYNALYVVGNGNGHYYKRQLVPFGEYLPFPKQLEWLMNYWQIPLSTLLPGKLQQAELQVDGFTIAPFICYEIAYTYLVEMIPAMTDFLVIVSNDAWFGESFAPSQHLQIAQFRAITTARPAVVSTNNGITAIVDDQGYTSQQLPQFATAVLTGEVTARHGTTPIMAIKSTRIIIFLWLLLAIAYYWQRKWS